MECPKVSIITVCYNAASVLEATMQSVLNQTYSNMEYIIIDGGSKDDTADIVSKYRSRIAVYVSEPDKGIYDAMNKGLKHATGEWINFMNAGDTFHDERVLEDVFGDSSPFADKLHSLKIIGGNTNNVHADHSWIHKAEPAEVIPNRIPFSHQACFVRPPFSFDLKYKLAADYKVLYDTYYNYGKESIAIIDRIIADYMKEGSFSTDNYRKCKHDYLIIQSSHPSWVWFKEVIKYILHY